MTKSLRKVTHYLFVIPINTGYNHINYDYIKKPIDLFVTKSLR